MLLCFSATAIPAQSWSGEKGLFFNYSTAQRLYIDLRFYREDAATKGEKLQVVEQDRALCNESLKLQDDKINGLTLDKAEYLKEANQYKAFYIKADEARITAENSKPSRLVWFGSGVLATLTAIVVGMVAK